MTKEGLININLHEIQKKLQLKISYFNKTYQKLWPFKERKMTYGVHTHILWVLGLMEAYGHVQDYSLQLKHRRAIVHRDGCGSQHTK